MKKIILGMAIACSVSLSAQVDFSQTRFGIKGGLNYSGVRNAHNPSGPIYAFQIGALALIPIDNDNQFYIQPEVLYYGAGETGRDKNAKKNPYYNAVYANNYISVPVNLKAYFSEAESEFFGVIGPRFNFLINQNIKNAPKKYTIEGDTKEVNGENVYVNGKAAAFNFAIGGGIGYSYKRQLELTLAYDLGLSNTYPKLIETYTKDPNTEKKKSEQVLSLTLSYIFQ